MLSASFQDRMNHIIHCTTISYEEIGRLVTAIGVWSITPQDKMCYAFSKNSKLDVLGRRTSMAVSPACSENWHEPISSSSRPRTLWKRKQIIEPVFGQIKSVRNFTRFSFRRIHKVIREWNLICLTHNLLKLYRLSLAT